MSKMISDVRTRCLANSVQTTILSSGVALFLLGTLVILLGFDVQARPADAASPRMPAIFAPASQSAAASQDTARDVQGPAVGVHALIGALLAQNEARSHGPAAERGATASADDQASVQ